MHKFYNIMQLVTISAMFFKDTLDRFMISFNLSIKIPNVISMYILVEDRIKVQFYLFSDNIAFIPLNEEYI